MWYHLSKTEAETVALEFAKTNGLDVVTVCPSLVLGPILQSTLTSSALLFFSLLKGVLVDALALTMHFLCVGG